MMDALPEGWAWVDVGDLASTPQDITDGPFGSNLKTEHYTPAGPRVIRLQNIGDGLFVDEKAHVSQAHFQRLKKHEVKPGDVVVAMLGEHLPRACVAPPLLGQAIVKADCVRLRPDPSLTIPKFVSAGLNSAAVRRQGDELVHGVGRPRLGLKLFRSLRFPLAPLAEQERVVDAIDSYLTRLDDGIASLKRVQATLKAYRASVLKAAVEGRLVPTEASLASAEKRAYEGAEALLARILTERRRRWEEGELDKLKAAGKRPKGDKWRARYREPVLSDSLALPELPEGWMWTRISTVGNVQLGRQRAPAHHQGTHMRPYLRVANVFEDRIDTGDVMTMNFTPEEFETYRLRFGDILLNEGQSPHLIGRPAMYRDEVPGACFQNTLIRFRATSGVDPRFALVVFRAQLHARRYMRIAQITTNIAHLGAGRFGEIEFPLPPAEEQTRIADEVDRLMSIANSVEESLHHQQARSARLRQSILKWAFEGKLVDQDSADEPADKLLARIQAERAAASFKKALRGRAMGAA